MSLSSLKSVSAIEMPTSYHRNADEMLFKTDNACQKVDAKKKTLNNEWQFPAVSILILLLLLFHLYLYFLVIIKMFVLS